MRGEQIPLHELHVRCSQHSIIQRLHPPFFSFPSFPLPSPLLPLSPALLSSPSSPLSCFLVLLFVTAIYSTWPSHYTRLSPLHAAFSLAHSTQLLLSRAAVSHAQLSLTSSCLSRAAISFEKMQSSLKLIILDDILFEGTLPSPLLPSIIPCHHC